MRKLLLLLAILFLGSIQANAQGQCQAYFQSTGCPTVTFFDASFVDSLSGDQVVSWNWDFGDGNTSTSASPLNTYGANGTYLACLTITTSQGCTSTYCDTIDISCIGQQGCQAGFQYSFDSICPSVMFSDASTASAGVVGWSWDFGDGNTSTSANPTHTYTANGGYIVCLTVYAADSCMSTYCDTLLINCIGQSGCQAAFQHTFDSICPSVMFYDGSTAGAGVVEWYWDFGDGNTSNAANPTHTYTANGTYTACLTIVAADSCVSTICNTVTINCIGQQGCQAAFQYTSDSICPTYMFFDGSSATAGVIGWSWDFGDGNTSTVANPTNTFATNGTYVVCLTMYSADSCTNTYCETVIVDCILGLEENAFENMYVSPNPAQNSIQLNLEQAHGIEYNIIGLSGAVYSSGSRPATDIHSFDISTLSNGMYLLNVNIDGKREVIRFIKE